MDDWLNGLYRLLHVLIQARQLQNCASLGLLLLFMSRWMGELEVRIRGGGELLNSRLQL